MHNFSGTPHQKASICFPCLKCKYGFRTADLLSIHVQAKHPPEENEKPKFRCEKCDFSSSTRKIFNKHFIFVHSTPNLEKKCEDCGKSYSNYLYLEMHRKFACAFTRGKFNELMRCFHCLKEARTKPALTSQFVFR